MAESEHKIRIIPLGGVDEFGKNITVVEYGEDMLVVDCGSIFPKEDMLGVDLVIPDVTYLIKNRERIRGMLLTHGHEDHIGATPYVLRQVPMALYGTKLTLALVDLKLKEHRIAGVPLNVVRPGDVIRLGCFQVRFLHVNHSIAGAVALAITCPAGTVVFSGDFKVDYTPIDGQVTDLAGFAELGSKGVLAFLCESTNIERKGYTMSETKIGQTFIDMFQQAKGRVIVAMFASNIHRVQMVVDSAAMFGRRVCFVGRSMVNVTRVAMSIGELSIPEENLIDVDDLENYADEEILVVTTGSQGEAMAGLTRMAYGEHRKLQIRPTDMVILSAHPIPGNEKPVARVINQLYRCGANVIYGQLGEVHVSGHASQEELKLMLAMAKPRYFMPVHGEAQHLRAHAELGVQMGVPAERVFVLDNGDSLEMVRHKVRRGRAVESGVVYVDGGTVTEANPMVLRDRQKLGADGVVSCTVVVSKRSGSVSAVEVFGRGVSSSTDELLGGEAQKLVRAQVEKLAGSDGSSIEALRRGVRNTLSNLLWNKTHTRPMIIPVVMEV